MTAFASSLVDIGLRKIYKERKNGGDDQRLETREKIKNAEDATERYVRLVGIAAS